MGLGGVGPDRSFWSSQRVFLTGHTGFKGAWAAAWLRDLGAAVFGYALAPDQSPNLHDRLAPARDPGSTLADVRDLESLKAAVRAARPTVILHMAAQPLVRRSYADPIETFGANIMGTANLLEAARGAADLRVALIVTTDKVYAHDGAARAFVEDDRLGGADPYSASKAAAELVTQSYRASYFKDRDVAVASARAGNVIGGGDWSQDRIVPDIWRAMHAGRPLVLRNPAAIRPWQHVLESLRGYFLYAEALARDPAAVPSALNFGPSAHAAPYSVAEVADRFGAAFAIDRTWIAASEPGPAEAQYLILDPAAAERALGWRARLTTLEAIDWTARWYRRFDAGEDSRQIVRSQIETYEALA